MQRDNIYIYMYIYIYIRATAFIRLNGDLYCGVPDLSKTSKLGGKLR